MISLSKIRNRALKFQNECAGEKYECSEAHEALDRVRSDTERAAHLFELNRVLMNLLDEPKKKK